MAVYMYVCIWLGLGFRVRVRVRIRVSVRVWVRFRVCHDNVPDTVIYVRQVAEIAHQQIRNSFCVTTSQ